MSFIYGNVSYVTTMTVILEEQEISWENKHPQTEETKWEVPALSIHDKNVHPNHMVL